MDNKAFYFPWVRKGLGGYINEKESLDGGTKGRPELTIRTDYMVQHNQQTAEEGEDTATEMFLEKTVKFVGPGDILRVNPSAIMKIHPDEGSDNFSTESIPYVEFWEPDFLWRYTPATHDKDRLRPWLALIVCRKEDIKLMTDSEGADSFSFIGDEGAWKRTFPAVEDLVFTAHAQGSTEDFPEFCRLLGLRNGDSSLDAHTEYVAMLIPSYEAGRQRGLGFAEENIQDIIAQQPAWEPTLDKQKDRPRGTEFPVYYKWYFKAGGESFDQLADKLAPCAVNKSGLKLDVTDMGEGFSYNTVEHKGNRSSITMPAATVTFDFPEQRAFPAKSGNSDEPSLYKRLDDLLKQNQVFLENKADIEGGIQEVLEGDEDPLIMPPVYGARHAMTTSLHDSSKPWVEELNLDIHHRAAAGLGRKVVQKHQEELMDRAWKQVEAVQALNMELYKRLLSFHTNQALQEKTVDSFGKTEDDKVDNSKYIAYMMRYLSTMKDAGADKYKLSDIIKNAGIPGSFAAPTFQNNVEKLSHIVAGLDTTTLMEHIVKDQLYKFETPDPAGAIDPVELERWCKETMEALIFEKYREYWKGFFDVSLDNSDTVRFKPKQFTWGNWHFLSPEPKQPDYLDLNPLFHFNDTLAYFHVNGNKRKKDYFEIETDYFHNFYAFFTTYNLAQIKKHFIRVYAIPDDYYDRFLKDGWAIDHFESDGSLIPRGNKTNIPLYAYALPDEQFNSIFKVEDRLVQVGEGTDAIRFLKPLTQHNDTVFVYNEAHWYHDFLKGHNWYDDFISSYPQYQTLDLTANHELKYYLYHLYHYKHLDRSFAKTVHCLIKLFIECCDSDIPGENVSYAISSGLPEISAGRYERFEDYKQACKRREKLLDFFNGHAGPSGIYNNVKDGLLLEGTTIFLKSILKYPGLLERMWESILGHPTILTRLCYERAFQAGLLTMLLAGAAGDSLFMSFKDGQLKYMEEKLRDPLYILVPQRYVQENLKLYPKEGLRETIKSVIPEIDSLEKAIPVAKKLQKQVIKPKPETPQKPVNDDAVERQRQSIVKQSTDEKDAYARIREVAYRYYELFFADTEEGEKLRETYLEELLMSKYPILAYPFFPEPTYYYLKMLSDKFIIPGLDEIEPETVAMFISNPQFTEAFLCGMNTEMGSELQWREYPTDRRGSYFRKFWDSDSSIEAITGDKFFDVAPLHLWKKALGKNHLAEKGSLLIFAIHSELLKLYPSTRIYLNKAKMKTGSTTQVEFAEGRKDPVMETFIREDLLLVGFNMTLSDALGNPEADNYGYMLTFEQDVDDLEFQYNENIKNWRSVDSSKSARRLVDSPSRFGKHVSLFVKTEK